MLRRTIQLLSRPKGPPGQRPGREYRLITPFRSEVAMLSQESSPKFNTNIRELFKKPLEMNNIKAIPRDLGELPRRFVLPLLFFHQPVQLLDLWELCKQHDDVPLDSAKHLRLVLKIAKLQHWVYAEKNQSDNKYYYYLHRSRVHEVQELIRQNEVRQKEKERDAERIAAEAQRALDAKRSRALDESIALLEQLIQRNVDTIRNFEADYEAP
eukprot:gene5700-4063_t